MIGLAEVYTCTQAVRINMPEPVHPSQSGVIHEECPAGAVVNNDQIDGAQASRQLYRFADVSPADSLANVAGGRAIWMKDVILKPLSGCQ
jgi:hypothetical protein